MGKSERFTIHHGDVGSEAYCDQYVQWLEAEIERLQRQLQDADGTEPTVEVDMKSATEMLQMALDACGDAANDHDYICECRPMDVRRVLAEIERLRERLAEETAKADALEACFEEQALKAAEAENEIERLRGATDHSVYCHMISLGMPEAMDGDKQTMWLYQYLADKDAEIERLKNSLAAAEIAGDALESALLEKTAAERELRQELLAEEQSHARTSKMLNQWRQQDKE